MPRPGHLFVVLTLLPAPAWAQSGSNGISPSVRRAAATITEADLRARLWVIAHDSMGGRDTPSPGLDKTAAWIASEFQRFGLKPGGDDGTFIQRYPIRRTRVDTVLSTIGVHGPDGAGVNLRFGRDAALIRGPAASGTWPVMLLGGPVDTLKPAPGEFRGKAVIWHPHAGLGASGLLRSFRHLARGLPALVIISLGSDSLMDGFVGRPSTPRLALAGMGGTPYVLIRESAVLAQVPDAGDTVMGLRASTGFQAIDLPAWNVNLAMTEDVLEEHLVPNTVGILEGSDPALRNEYIVFSAHMDHDGVRPRAANQPATADTIWNGADDDGSGTVGIVELAEAFSRPGARPRRSMIFLTVSGEEKGLWGSDWFAAHPPVPIGQIVANLNADMIGRNWKDTIVVIGKEHSDLGRTLARVTAAHPEIGMAAIDDLWPEQSFYTRSDHFNFARRGVPVLFFFNGTHEDYHRPSDEVEKIDFEKMTRIVRLMYWLGQDIGNAARRPEWNPESYARFVTERPGTP